MTGPIPLRGIARCCAVLCALLPLSHASGHGGVFLEDDVCVIQIGFLKAHFTVFQPRTRQQEEFCEDLPDVAETVFVLEYLHEGLETMPIEFRIIRDVTELGRFAKLAAVAQIEDLEKATVLYQAADADPDVLAVVHQFDAPGNYIGIVTASDMRTNKVYTAVFPFEVGGSGFGYVPLFAALLIFLQLNYWLMSGALARWRARFTKAKLLGQEA